VKNFDTRVYSISDFLEWRNGNLLELSPDFQRRPVWSQTAKSYLIDTIVRGKPMPKLIITQKLLGSRIVRCVVDGQQRLRAILDYRDGNYKISRAHNKEYAGLTYDRLPEQVQKDFMKYELGVDLLFDMAYEDILDIFARINTYTVVLNTQEKRNAKFVGYFKQLVYQYGYKYINYFIAANILTKRTIARMAEAELSAELLGALVGGVQSNKTTGTYYKKYEEEFENMDQYSARFDEIMSYIGEIYPPADLARTNWSRIHLFYTLFTVIGHCLFGLVGLDSKLRVPIDRKVVGKFRICLDDISLKYDEFTSKGEKGRKIPSNYTKFIDFSRRRTTDTAARKGRAEFVCQQLKSYLSE